MRTLKMDGMEKIMMGLTDIKMVRSVCIKWHDRFKEDIYRNWGFVT
jgi:hypothetical protein